MRIYQLLCLLLTVSFIFTGCFSPRTEAEQTPFCQQSQIRSLEKQTQVFEETPSKPSQPLQNRWETCAYLPVSSALDDVTPYAENIALLDYLILNTGVYWNENRELEVSQAFSLVADTLSEQTELWCTINPKGELIRSETAGDTIDTSEERQALAEKIADFAVKQNLSGIDIDWEFPLESEWEDFSAFLVTLSNTLEDISVEISLALYPHDIYLNDEAIAAIDRIHVMAYDQFDQNGYHSTMQTAKDSINYFLSLGFSSQQLFLGIPAYGRPLDASAQWIFYSEIDPSAVPSDNPNLIGDVFFNGTELAAEKAQYAEKQELGGVMLYHLLCDKTDKQSLIYAICKNK